MDRLEKRQCIKIADALADINTEIVKKLADTPQVLQLLKGCMEAAVAVAEQIEKSEGDGTDAAKALEKYSGALYRLYEDITGNVDLNSNKIDKILRKSIDNVRGKINALHSKTEIVFLPYKASMWDSLESVWREADRDESCDAYVIPIPYYDRSPDGSFGAFHYEGSLYPKDVPVVSYKEYDFENRHPDKIYIHNPYDENNYVTSVDPFFYSSNLKKFTDELIYIPYFVLDDPDPENEESLEGIEHLVAMPGVVNADKVIVQSENMRKAYIKILTKYLGQSNVWERKIIGSGSPKFDRVKNLKDEDYKLPDDWLDIVTKPDGSRKKIVLYNTGLSAFLDHNEKMIVKIRDILKVFKENTEDVALLWRPHPLIEATLVSMRPQLWEEYKEIVGEYKAEKWGIYDDSPELDRAIAVSDAYYGDWSSVVQLYKETGKPIMIENPDIYSEV